MHKLVTFEFIQYQAGFINGKEDLFYKITNELDDELELELDYDDCWYIYGYNCALAYYNLSYNKYKTVLCFFDDEDFEEVIINSFIETVIEYNKQTKEKVPVAQYIIR